jgi:colanic acid biosynthesis glycosyl transferase WcaI
MPGSTSKSHRKRSLSAESNRTPTVHILYHYFYPDDVVSAIHLAELASGLSRRGWGVTALPCNRGCRDETRTYSAEEHWRGVHIRRIWRPRFKQGSSLGRLLNAAWMITAWSLRAVRRDVPDVLIVGTDPVLSVVVAAIWRFLKPNVRTAHWAFDLYPEAAIADGALERRAIVTRTLDSVLRKAYKACDIVVDLGGCMREQITKYGVPARSTTLVPWAISEPQASLPRNQLNRERLFPGARLVLLYSGNFGRAHSFEELLNLARRLKDDGIWLAFSVRGNRAAELRSAVRESDTNIRFIPFAESADLQSHLSLGDVHIVTLREEWTGAVVPSKFFGALAAGRPVLFVGSRKSAIAGWIKQYGLGWTLSADNMETVAHDLRSFVLRSESLSTLFDHCRSVYHSNFSRETMLDSWDRELRDLVGLQDKAEFLAPQPAENFKQSA